MFTLVILFCHSARVSSLTIRIPDFSSPLLYFIYYGVVSYLNMFSSQTTVQFVQILHCIVLFIFLTYSKVLKYCRNLEGLIQFLNKWMKSKTYSKYFSINKYKKYLQNLKKLLQKLTYSHLRTFMLYFYVTNLNFLLSHKFGFMNGPIIRN